MKIKVLYRAWIQLIKMLSDRDYDVSEYIDKNGYPLQYEDFEDIFIDGDNINVAMELSKDDERNSSMWVQYIIDKNNPDDKIKKDIIKNTIYKEMIDRNIFNGIILTETGVTTPTSKQFSHLRFNIEIFPVSKMLRNPITHNSAPKYEVIKDQEELENIIYGSNVTEDTYMDLFPAMSINDPVSRWYDMKEGDIVRITRKYPKNMVTYRVVKRLINVPDKLDFS